jgi:hypothetical protein
MLIRLRKTDLEYSMLCRLIKEICEDLKFPYVHLSRWMNTATAASAMQTNLDGLLYHAVKDNRDLLVVRISHDRYIVHPHGVLKMARRRGKAMAVAAASRIRRRLDQIHKRLNPPQKSLLED